MIKIVRAPIDLNEILCSVKSPEAGAIDIFIGTTRNHSDGKEVLSLEYEAYEPMAVKLMEGIVAEARQRWTVKRIAIVHRVGKVEIGEASVIVVVSAAHRREAFEACRYAIDALKKDVPIWKKEVFRDGEAWVGLQSESLANS
ncbi:MAG: molybdenum cofactor biosynthesis protein MoaE [Bacteroidota bacterium]